MRDEVLSVALGTTTVRWRRSARARGARATRETVEAFAIMLVARRRPRETRSAASDANVGEDRIISSSAGGDCNESSADERFGRVILGGLLIETRAREGDET